jgi:DNA-binding beta-propeller fold protein YncE
MGAGRRFLLGGLALVAMGSIGLATDALAESPPVLIRSWGSSGSGPGEFASPSGIAVEGWGNVYVADSGNFRIQEFDPSGNFLLQWSVSTTGASGPTGVAVDPSGKILVTVDGLVGDPDQDCGSVRVFNSGGALLETWGPTPDYFWFPQKIAVAASGFVYVVDYLGMDFQAIRKFDAGGSILTSWTAGWNMGPHLQDLAVHPDGRLFVAYWAHVANVVHIFDANGLPLSEWGPAGGELDSPDAIAVDPTGAVYVSNYSTRTIYKYDAQGAPLTSWGTSPFIAADLACDAAGNLYALGHDQENWQVREYSSSAVSTRVRTWGAIKAAWR